MRFFLFVVSVSVAVTAQSFPPNADLARALPQLQDGMQVQAMTVDSAGNVYLAGTTAGGFATATTRLGPRGETDLFIVKTNAAGDQILYSVWIGGSSTETLRAIRVDASGSLYVLGSTASQDFPSIAKFNPTFPVGAVLFKLNPAGTALTYATQLGSQMTALGLDVDSAGAAYVSGATYPSVLTPTPGVLQPAPPANATPSDFLGFVARLNPAGTAWEAATFLGPLNRGVEHVAVRPEGVLVVNRGVLSLLNTTLSQSLASVDTGLFPANLALDSAGNVYLAGTLADGGFALRKFSAGGFARLLDRSFPLVSGQTPPRLAIAPNGRIFLFGQALKPDFPTKNATQACLASIAAPNGYAGYTLPGPQNPVGADSAPLPGDQTLTVLEASGEVLHATFTTVIVAQAAVAPATGRIYTAASHILFTQPQRTTWRGIVRFHPETLPPTRVSPSCVVHGAYFTPAPLTPGALMTIFGDQLGPAAFTSFQLDANNRVPTTLAGVAVTVDGRPAPILFTYERQINFIVPWATRTDGAAVPVCVSFNGATTCIQASTGVAAPGAFQCGAVSCALNQNFSQNLPNNGAEKGSYVAVYLTGFGMVDGTVVDGGVAGLPLQPVRGVLTVTSEYTPPGCLIFACAAVAAAQTTEVVFAGAAPGLVQGVNQINFRIPPDTGTGLQTFTISFTPAGAKDPIRTEVKLQVK
jgi:uncharacterized protein (TIGR03437 family)